MFGFGPKIWLKDAQGLPPNHFILAASIHARQSQRILLTMGWEGRQDLINHLVGRLIFIHLQCWEVPPLFCDNSSLAVYKIQSPEGTEFNAPLVLNCQRAALPSTGDV